MVAAGVAAVRAVNTLGKALQVGGVDASGHTNDHIAAAAATTVLNISFSSASPTCRRLGGKQLLPEAVVFPNLPQQQTVPPHGLMRVQLPLLLVHRCRREAADGRVGEARAAVLLELIPIVANEAGVLHISRAEDVPMRIRHALVGAKRAAGTAVIVVTAVIAMALVPLLLLHSVVGVGK